MPPVLLYVKMHKWAEGNIIAENWVLVRSFDILADAQRHAEDMCQAYNYRIYLSPEQGHLYLTWEDDPTDTDSCIPVWRPLTTDH